MVAIVGPLTRVTPNDLKDGHRTLDDIKSGHFLASFLLILLLRYVIISCMTKDKVKRLRKQLGMTQQQLADTLGVTQTSVGRWEIGMHQIEEPTARLLKLLVQMKKKSQEKK